MVPPFLVRPDNAGTAYTDGRPAPLPAFRGVEPPSGSRRAPERVEVAHHSIRPPSRQVVERIPLGGSPSALALGGGAVWVANSLDSTVSKIDPSLGRVAATIPVGSDPVALAVSGRWVSVANEFSSTVSRIDAHRGLVVQTTVLGGGPTALAAA